MKENKQFEVSLLWKDSDPQLSDIVNVAIHRPKCLVRKFKRNPNKPGKVRLVWDAAAKPK